jgi:hypothetical protein
MDEKALTKRQRVAIALYLVGGAHRAIDIEDLAVKAAEMSPRLFRWRSYPDQIDLDSVRLCAKNLAAPPDPFVQGGIRDGWMLTPAGIAWCQAALQRHPSIEQPSPRSAATVRHSETFAKFASGRRSTITIHDVRHMLRVDEYTSKRRRREQIRALENTIAGDTALSECVSYLKNRFPEEWI